MSNFPPLPHLYTYIKNPAIYLSRPSFRIIKYRRNVIVLTVLMVPEVGLEPTRYCYRQILRQRIKPETVDIIRVLLVFCYHNFSYVFIDCCFCVVLMFDGFLTKQGGFPPHLDTESHPSDSCTHSNSEQPRIYISLSTYDRLFVLHFLYFFLQLF